MVKKRVPEWLNSSLWSSPPAPDDDRLRRYASKSAAAAPEPLSPASESAPPKVDPPMPVPPPAYEERDSAKRRENDGPRAAEADSNGAAGAATSAEAISRQAELLAEVGFFVFSLRRFFSRCLCLFPQKSDMYIYCVVVEEGDKYARFEANRVAGYTRRGWDSFDSVEGIYDCIFLLSVWLMRKSGKGKREVQI